MSLLEFPIAPSGFIEKYRHDTIRTRFDQGKVSVRPKWSTGKNEFTFTWHLLTNAQKITLKEFIIGNIGLEFDFENDLDDETYSVVFSEDEFEFKIVALYEGGTGLPMWSLELKVIET